MSSHISAFKSVDAGISVPTATDAEAMFQNFGNGAATTITFASATVAVEIINDDPVNNLAINFTGSGAAIPGVSGSVVGNHLVRPKEARYFPVQVTSCSVIGSAASVQGRVTGYTV